MKSASVWSFEDTTVGICALKQHASCDEEEDLCIVLEAMKVLQHLAMLFELMYALNLSYPDLRFIFEEIQKILMELH